MSKFCVVKSTIENEEAIAIINQDNINFLTIEQHPMTKQDVYYLVTKDGKYYFTEFVIKEASLQEALEYCRYQHYK